MKPSEAVREIEDTWDKKLKPKQTDRYLRALGKYNQTDIDMITERVIEESKYFPKIADFTSAAKDLLILQPVRRVKADRKCETCRGVGWEFVKATDKQSGDLVEAVKRCVCRVAAEEVPF